MKKKKVMFISSTGGHFVEIMQLKPLFKDYDYHIVTETTENNLELRKEYGKKIEFLIFGSKDHKFVYPFKLLINCFLCLYKYICIFQQKQIFSKDNSIKLTFYMFKKIC